MVIGIVAALTVAACAWLANPDPEWALLGSILGWNLLALAWIDWQTLRLPDALTLPLIALGLLASWHDSSAALYDGAAGAVASYIAFMAVAVCYRLLRGHDGLGGGDAKLLAAGGAWLGLAAVPWVVLLAALLGLSLALAERLRNRTLTGQTMLPFGPPLALAIWIIWLVGLPIE